MHRSGSQSHIRHPSATTVLTRSDDDYRGEGSTSLDPWKDSTNASPEEQRDEPFEPDQPSRLQRLYHGPRMDELVRLADVLGSDPDRRFNGRARRLRTCGYSPIALVRSNASVGLSIGRCRDRLCPTCARARAHDVRRRVAAACRDTNALRFVTLTLKHSDDDLGKQIDHLLASFRRLRQRAAWKARVDGGIGCIEVKLSQEDGRWHPHLHVLVDGKYFDQRLLSSEWQAVTSGSSVCWITAVPDRAAAAGYVAKYAAKPPSMDLWEDIDIRTYAAATARRRFLLAFGSLHNKRVEAEPGEVDINTVVASVHVSMVRRAVCEGDAGALQHVPVLASAGGWWRALLADLSLLDLSSDDPPTTSLADAAQWLADFASVASEQRQFPLLPELRGSVVDEDVMVLPDKKTACLTTQTVLWSG